jgi:uncharacterized protein involved in cysteine biosynthesis
MVFVIRGITLVYGNRRFWPYVWRPMAISAIIFVAIAAIVYFLLVPPAQGALGRIGIGSAVAGFGANAAFIALLWLMSSILFVFIAGITSSFLWDRLSYEVELTVNPTPPKHATNAAEWLIDALPRMGFAAFVFCLSSGCFWILPIGVALASWLCLYDFTASAYLRRGTSFLAQFALAPRVRGWATFALTCGLMTLLPFINVLVLPGLVAGGTLMVAEGERS